MNPDKRVLNSGYLCFPVTKSFCLKSHAEHRDKVKGPHKLGALIGDSHKLGSLLPQRTITSLGLGSE